MCYCLRGIIPQPLHQQSLRSHLPQLGQHPDDHQLQQRVPKVLVQVPVPPYIQLAFHLPDPLLHLLGAKHAPENGGGDQGEQRDGTVASNTGDFGAGRGWGCRRWEGGVGEEGLAEGAEERGESGCWGEMILDGVVEVSS